LTKILVWDFPTRAFHWLLVIAICFSVYTGLNGGFVEMDYHMYSGYFILSLVIFRVSWGVLSKGNARFTRFIAGPKELISYIESVRNNDPKNYPGHNPLGGLSVLSLLFILLVQTMTGLFSNDDILVEGPLVHLISDELSSLLTTLHHFSAICLGGLIALHLSAIIYHEIVLKHKIVIPMLTGRKSVEAENGAENKRESDTIARNETTQNQQLPLALILFILALSLVFILVTYL